MERSLSMARVLARDDEPGLGRAAGGIVAGSVLPHLPEHFLQNLLGRLPVTEHTANQAEGEARMRVVEALEGLAIAAGDTGDRSAAAEDAGVLERMSLP